MVREDIKDDILNYIIKNPWCTTKEIKTETGYHKQVVSNTLKELKAKGVIERILDENTGAKRQILKTAYQKEKEIHRYVNPGLEDPRIIAIIENEKLKQGELLGATYKDTNFDLQSIIDSNDRENRMYGIAYEALKDRIDGIKKPKILENSQLVKKKLIKKSEHSNKKIQDDYKVCRIERGVYKAIFDPLQKEFPKINVEESVSLNEFHDTYSDPDNLLTTRPLMNLSEDIREGLNVSDKVIIGKYIPNGGDIIILTNITTTHNDKVESLCYSLSSLEKQTEILLKTGQQIRLILAYEQPSCAASITFLFDHYRRFYNLLFNSSFKENVKIINANDETTDIVEIAVETPERDMPTIIFTVRHDGKKDSNNRIHSIKDIIKNTNGIPYCVVSLYEINGKHMYGISHGDLLLGNSKIGHDTLELINKTLRMYNQQAHSVDL